MYLSFDFKFRIISEKLRGNGIVILFYIPKTVINFFSQYQNQYKHFIEGTCNDLDTVYTVFYEP